MADDYDVLDICTNENGLKGFQLNRLFWLLAEFMMDVMRWFLESTT